MFSKVALRAAAQPMLRTSSQVRNYKVAVLGAAGGIGQPLSLLLKLNDKVTHLALYDVAPVTPGVAAEQAVACTWFKAVSHWVCALPDAFCRVVCPAVGGLSGCLQGH